MKIIIEGGKTNLSHDLKELFRYKDLFFSLAFKDFRVRYAQTFLGFTWAFIQPFTTLLIFTIVFGKAAKIETNNIPYPLFAICGLSIWNYFSFVLNQSGNSIVGAQEMIKKIYFPRLIIPLSKSLVGFIDFGVALLFLALIMVFYSFGPSSNFIYFPIFLLIGILTALSIGIWLSALTIRFRDFQHVIPFIIQLGLYATPIAYPSSFILEPLPDWFSYIYFLNPMAGVVEGFRWSVLGTPFPHEGAFISFTLTIVLFVSSLLYFKKVEKDMADII